MKKTPNQIREEVRRQMANQRDAEIEQLKADKERYWKMFEKADMAYKAKCIRVEELEEKVKQLEDWNRRLMEFMDMNEEERKAALILSKSIKLGQSLVEAGERDASVVRTKMIELLETEPMADVEYVNVVNNNTMEDIDTIQGDILVAMAVKINNKVRLIDNFMMTV